MGDVINLPDRGAPAARQQSGAAPMRWLTTWDIDDWGRDDTLTRLAARLSGIRWDTAIGGEDQLPAEGPVLAVVNSKRFRLTPWWVALTLSAAVRRPVRFVGRPDVAPFGAVARRLGGLLARPDEVAGALRHGQFLVIGLSGTRSDRRVGSCEPRLLAAAVEQKVPVFPVAATVSDVSRTARLEVGAAVTAPRRRRGPLAELELALLVEERIGELLESFGESRTGTPLDWLPISVLGRD